MTVVAVILSFGSLLVAPALAARMMGLKGGIGKGALVGLLTLGLLQVSGLLASLLGPLGELLSIMAFLAAWYQVVKVVHGTDTASTVVFMFWHLFFVLLATSLLAIILNPSAATAAWAWAWTSA